MAGVDLVILHDVNKALDLKLYDWQVEYLVYGSKTNYPYFKRRSGRTMAHILDLLLSDVYGEPIDIRKMENYSDMRGSLKVMEHIGYSRGFYRRWFLDIKTKLNKQGLKTREITDSQKKHIL